MNNYYTYILRCEDNSLYTGITTNIKRRFLEHKNKTKLGAKYTHNHKVISIEILFMSSSRSLSSKLEYRIKRLSKEGKETIIRTKSLEILKDKLNINDYKIIENIE